MGKPLQTLSHADKQSGRRRFIGFALLNGFVFALVAEGLLPLYALKLEMPPAWVAAMGSFGGLAMPFMFLGRALVPALGVAALVNGAFAARSVAAAALAAAPLVSGLVSTRAGHVVVLVSVFAFYALRGVGTAGWNPLVAELASPAELPRFNAFIILGYSVSNFAGIALCLSVLRLSDGMAAYQLLILFGCLCGVAAAFLLRDVKETGTPRLSAARPLSGDARFLASDRRGRGYLVSYCLFLSSVALTGPVATLVMKKGYGLGDHDVLFFVLASLAAGGAASFAMRRLPSGAAAGRTATTAFTCGNVGNALLFLCAPSVYNVWFAAAAYTLAGACAAGGSVAITQQYMSVVPAERRVGCTILANVFSGVVSGVVGAVGGGGALALLARAGVEGLSLYRCYFALVAAALAAAVAANLWLRRRPAA